MSSFSLGRESNLQPDFDGVQRIADDQRAEAAEAPGEDVEERVRPGGPVNSHLRRHRGFEARKF